MKYLCLLNIGLFFTMTSLWSHNPQLLSDPFLLLPAENSVKVVWFTAFEGRSHFVEWGEEKHRVQASSRLMSRIREDIAPIGCIKINTWRHEATIEHLPKGQRQLYQVFSQTEEGQLISSKCFSLAPAPLPNQPLKILFTSDHQRKPMVAANIQKAAETIGRFDAIFSAGDQIEYPDGFQDWFKHPLGFLPCLQGHANGPVEGKMYHGAEVIQHTPLFPTIGNHEVMGRYSLTKSLQQQFNDPYPKDQNSNKDASFNTDTFEEMFSLPPYYAVSFGDIRLIVLYATRIWRSPVQDALRKGKYDEAQDAFDHPEQWGYGDFIFESLNPGSAQYNWLVDELESPSFKEAKLRMVMLHNPLHTLGENAVPPFTDPIQTIERDASGKITAIHYAYPKDKDVLIQHIEPLLEKYGVDLVLNGHCHLWNRFKSSKGMHFIETSNVGNSYGAYTTENGVFRDIVLESDPQNYALVDDPNGLEPIIPTLAPLKNEKGDPLPYISSNHITVFSVLDTEQRVIESYYYDCKHPEQGVVKFDSFCPYRATQLQEEPLETVQTRFQDV